MGTTSLWAQNSRKPYVDYLPEQGDIALGIDVVPILQYVGNMFNGYGQNGTPNSINSFGYAPSFNGPISPNVSIMGKYMITDEVAIKANIGVLINTFNQRGFTRDDEGFMLNPLSELQVIDQATLAKFGGSIQLGAEYRVGTKRVQGVFGGSLLFAFENTNQEYHWGNGITALNPAPSKNDIMPDYTISSISEHTRILSNYSQGASYYTGVTGSVGIECFVAPKISIGGEVNLTLYYQFGATTSQKIEGYNTITERTEQKTTLLSPGNSGFFFGTQNLGASLFMMFYF